MDGASIAIVSPLKSERNSRHERMDSTYEKLANWAIDSYRSLGDGGEKLWIGVGGAPGSGKSTLADAVAERVNNLGVEAVVIPMDGYHYTKAELSDRNYPMTRRGAPWTLDAEQLTIDLKVAKHVGEAGFPEYCRMISDPLPDRIRLEQKHQIVLVEGLYVLLGSLMTEVGVPGSNVMDAANNLGCPTPIGEEIKRWVPMTTLLDHTLFVFPTGGFEENRRRLIERSLQTRNSQKTLIWGGGADREAATRRVDLNDSKNVFLIDCCRPHARVQIESV